MLPEDISDQKQQVMKKFAEGLKLFYSGDFQQAQTFFPVLPGMTRRTFLRCPMPRTY